VPHCMQETLPAREEQIHWEVHVPAISTAALQAEMLWPHAAKQVLGAVAISTAFASVHAVSSLWGGRAANPSANAVNSYYTASPKSTMSVTAWGGFPLP